MKLAIIIVNYKNYQKTKNCLDNLFKFLPKKYLDNIILIDNKTGCDIYDIEKKFKEIKFIKNKENLGFAKAVNQGIEFGLKNNVDYFLLLNPDTKFNFDFITPLIEKNFDLVSPILKFQRKGEWILDFGGKVNWLIGRPFHIEKKLIISNQLSIINNNLDYISGCCLLIKSNVIKKIGLFNEQYFLYFEDVDFCLRTKRAGFNLGVDHSTTITHLLEEEITEARKFKLKQLLGSHLIFINNWIPVYFRPFALIYHLWLSLRTL